MNRSFYYKERKTWICLRHPTQTRVGLGTDGEGKGGRKRINSTLRHRRRGFALCRSINQGPFLYGGAKNEVPMKSGKYLSSFFSRAEKKRRHFHFFSASEKKKQLWRRTNQFSLGDEREKRGKEGENSFEDVRRSFALGTGIKGNRVAKEGGSIGNRRRKEEA